MLSLPQLVVSVHFRVPLNVEAALKRETESTPRGVLCGVFFAGPIVLVLVLHK